MAEAAMKHAGRVNYLDLDIMKLVMAFLVDEIHTRPLKGLPLAETLIEGFDVVAVPFFFMASAFLCFRGLDESAFSEASIFRSHACSEND